RPLNPQRSTFNHFGAEFLAKSALVPLSTLNHLAQPAPFHQLALGAWLFSGAWSFSNGAEFLTKSVKICAHALSHPAPQPSISRKVTFIHLCSLNLKTFLEAPVKKNQLAIRRFPSLGVAWTTKSVKPLQPSTFPTRNSKLGTRNFNLTPIMIAIAPITPIICAYP
ncbi:MAG: hypothetical protein JWQ04_1777, partial [Pedosphaera sp.]|nr:hypothetical protein [Pedosphaera sp.]